MTGILRRLVEDDRVFPFLLIGGHAVTLHGHSRSTFDLDLMVPEESVDSWCEFLSKLGLREFHRTEAFIQFEGTAGIQPIDLMVVTEETFLKMQNGSEIKLVDGVEVSVPSPTHLIALKLHATRQEKRKVKEQDWSDVVGLIRCCDLDMKSETFREIINRYGGPEAEGEIRRRLLE